MASDLVSTRPINGLPTTLILLLVLEIFKSLLVKGIKEQDAFAFGEPVFHREILHDKESLGVNPRKQFNSDASESIHSNPLDGL